MIKLKLKAELEYKLDTCPNCGSDPNEEPEEACYPMNRERTLWAAGCFICGAYIEDGTSAVNAIRKWNKYAR